MNWETIEKPSRLNGRMSSSKPSRRSSIRGSKRSGTDNSFRVKDARVCAFHGALWYFTQEVLKTSLDRILSGVGRYLDHIPPGARELLRSYLPKTENHGFIPSFNGRTLINPPKLRVAAALLAFPAFLVKENIYCCPGRQIFLLWQDAFAEPNMSVHDEEEETRLILWGENTSQSYISSLFTVRHLFEFTYNLAQ